MISGYALRQNRKEEKVQFCDDLSEEIGQAGSDELVMLLCDLKGHVGWVQTDMKVCLEDVDTEYGMRMM